MVQGWTTIQAGPLSALPRSQELCLLVLEVGLKTEGRRVNGRQLCEESLPGTMLLTLRKKRRQGMQRRGQWHLEPSMGTPAAQLHPPPSCDQAL